MDSNKLCDAINNHLFIDLVLTLKDNISEITMNLHKIILYSSCIYFEKLLTTCKERNLDKITIFVPNAFVIYDIIMSFYHQNSNISNLSKWKHLIESAKCYDFLGLPF